MIRCTRRRFVTLMGALAAASGHTAWAGGLRPAAVIEFGDLERFESLLSGASAAALVASYLAEESPGLAAYRKAYRVTGADLADRLQERPRFYRSLAGLRARLRPFEDEALQAMARVRELVPGTPEVPVFVFVGTLGPGATVKEVGACGGGPHGLGILIPVEALALTPSTDMSEFPEGRAGRADASAFAGLVAHEYAHVAQVQLQGLERYRTIYTEPGRNTHLAFAIREGAADLLSWLASGQLRERHRYMLANHSKLWREFRPLAGQPVSSSYWFGRNDPQFPERPPQLGYALGWSICRHFHENAEDQPHALRQLLSAVEPADFDAILARYRVPG